MKRDINFFSAYQGKKQDIKEKQNNLVLYIVMGLVAAFIIGTFGYHKIGIYLYEKKITEFEEKMADPEHQKQLAIAKDLSLKISNTNQYINQVDEITSAVDSRKVITPEILDDVQDAVPDEIIFSDYTISNTTIGITGNAPSIEIIAQMEHNFRELERTQDVHVSTSTKSDDGIISFDIKVSIKDVE